MILLHNLLSRGFHVEIDQLLMAVAAGAYYHAHVSFLLLRTRGHAVIPEQTHWRFPRRLPVTIPSIDFSIAEHYGNVEINSGLGLERHASGRQTYR